MLLESKLMLICMAKKNVLCLSIEYCYLIGVLPRIGWLTLEILLDIICIYMCYMGDIVTSENGDDMLWNQTIFADCYFGLEFCILIKCLSCVLLGEISLSCQIIAM